MFPRLLHDNHQSCLHQTTSPSVTLITNKDLTPELPKPARLGY